MKPHKISHSRCNNTNVTATGATLPVLNQLFSSGAIVLHLGVTNCYWGLWGNMISGSVLNQLVSSGAIVLNLGLWGNSLFLW